MRLPPMPTPTLPTRPRLWTFVEPFKSQIPPISSRHKQIGPPQQPTDCARLFSPAFWAVSQSSDKRILWCHWVLSGGKLDSVIPRDLRSDILEQQSNSTVENLSHLGGQTYAALTLPHPPAINQQLQPDIRPPASVAPAVHNDESPDATLSYSSSPPLLYSCPPEISYVG